MGEPAVASAKSKKVKSAEQSQEEGNRGWFGPSALIGGSYQEGSVLANRAGLQLARIATINTVWRLRQRAVDADLRAWVEAYERDGFLVIEDFLPAETFEAVRAECRRAYADGLFRAEVAEDNNVIEENLRAKGSKLPLTREALRSYDVLNRLAAAIIRRPSIEQMSIDVNFMTKSKDAPPPARLVGTNYIHADVHYPSGKAWLYLDDIDESNGALVYARGSQKMRPARLAHEYDASVRAARAKEDGTLYTEVSACVARMPTERQMRGMKLVETAVSGRANTLLFANVMGFHKRGEFDEGRRREQIQIRFTDRPRDRKQKK